MDLKHLIVPHHRIIRLFSFALSMFAQLSNSLRPPFYLEVGRGEEEGMQAAGVFLQGEIRACNATALGSSSLPLPYGRSHLQVVLGGELQLWIHKRDSRIVPALFICRNYFFPSRAKTYVLQLGALTVAV